MILSKQKQDAPSPEERPRSGHLSRADLLKTTTAAVAFTPLAGCGTSRQPESGLKSQHPAGAHPTPTRSVAERGVVNGIPDKLHPPLRPVTHVISKPIQISEDRIFPREAELVFMADGAL